MAAASAAWAFAVSRSSVAFQILTADRRISQNGDVGRLHFHHATGHRHQNLVLGTRHCQTQYAGVDTGQKRHVTRVDTDLAFRCRSHEELRFASVNLLFGADHFHMHLGHEPSP